MNSILYWAITVAIIAIGVTVFKYNQKGIPLSNLFKREGLGILRGIIIFILFPIIIWLIIGHYTKVWADEWRGFSYTEITIGGEQTFKQSPMCEQGEPSDKLTSNGEIKQNIVEYKTNRFAWSTDVGYRHHSCWMNEDRFNYDALFISTSLKICWKDC